jgi:hypothetical protein
VTQLRESLARRDVSKTDKYLLIVAMHDGPMKANDIRAVARQSGWRNGSSSIPGDYLKQTTRAIYVPTGWTVTARCRKELEERGFLDPMGVLTPVTQALEKYLQSVTEPDRARFVEEAVQCVKNKAYRAAIVLTWVGAVYLLYKHVLVSKLAEFNEEARRRNSKWKGAVNEDDLTGFSESDFLNMLEHIGVLTKAGHKELKNCLDRRNTVGAHIHELISNVYAKY